MPKRIYLTAPRGLHLVEGARDQTTADTGRPEGAHRGGEQWVVVGNASKPARAEITRQRVSAIDLLVAGAYGPNESSTAILLAWTHLSSSILLFFVITACRELFDDSLHSASRNVFGELFHSAPVEF